MHLKSRIKAIIDNKYFFPISCFLISFLVYVRTLAPTAYWGDAAELTTAIYVLGIPHPPGIPLYVLIGKLFTLIPIGTIAWRVNLMSAFFAALSVMLLYIVTHKLSKDRITGFLAAMILAAAPTFWDYSTAAEVYTLNAFFMLSGMLLLLKWKETGDRKFLYIFSIIYGLSLSNYIASIILMPAYLYFIFVKNHRKFSNIRFDRRVLDIKVLSVCAMLFLAGLLPYAYLPVQSTTNPALDWGNPETLPSFITHVTAQEYNEKFAGKESIIAGVEKFIILLFFQHHILTALFFLGIFLLWRRFKKNLSATYFLSLIFISYIVFNITRAISDIDSYYIPIFILTSLFIGLGAGFLINKFRKNYLKIGISLLLLGLLFSASLVLNPEVDKSSDRTAGEYAQFILGSVENDAVILTNRDEHSVLFYYHFVDRMKPDAIITPAQCIKDDFCIVQLRKNNLVIITKDFGSPINRDDLISFIDEMRPRKVYVTDLLSRVNKDDESSWRIYPLEEYLEQHQEIR